MTDPASPPTDDDLSAVLDGTADPALVARVEADPAAGARLDGLRGAVAAVQQPVAPLDPATVDRLVATALDAADPGGDRSAGAGGGRAEPDPDAVVAPLRRRTAPTPPPWLVAASIVGLVAIGLVLVWSGRDGGPTDQAAVPSAEQADSSSGGGQTGGSEELAPSEDPTRGDGLGDGAGGAATTSAAGDLEATTTSPAVGADALPGSLGEYPTLEALRTALRDGFPAAGDAPPGGPLTAAQVPRCASLMRQVFDLPADPTRTGRATVEGADVLVYEFAAPSVRDGTPTTFVTVNDPASCDARLSFERDPG